MEALGGVLFLMSEVPSYQEKDFIEKGFQFKTFLAMKFTTQHDIY